MNNMLGKWKNNIDYKGGLDDEDAGSGLIQKFDSKFLRWLVRFHNVLGRDKIDIGDLGDLVQALQHMYEDQRANYVEALLYPEYVVAARIPRIIPIKAAAFKSTYEYRFQCSTIGTFAIVFNPYIYAPTGSTKSGFHVNTAATLVGNASNNNFIATDLGWNISTIYSEVCLVSHAVTVEAQVNSNTNSGTIVSGIVHDPLIADIDISFSDSGLAKYGNFTLARTGFFNDSINVNQVAGIRTIGFPIDNTFEEFLNNTTPDARRRLGFAHVLTGVGLQPSATMIVRVVANWEALPDPAFVNIMPSSFGPAYIGSEEKSLSIKKVQQKPIGPYNANLSPSENGLMNDKEGFFDTIKRFARSYLPSISTIASTIGGLVGGPGGAALGGLGGSALSSMFGGGETPQPKFVRN